MRAAITIAGFLTVFLRRRVLRRGALRLPVVRWTLTAGMTLALAAACATGVVTLRKLIVDPALLTPLLRVAGTSAPVWVLGLFAVVRLLFLRSGELVELTYSFPVTNRSRTLGFMVFEVVLVALGAVVVLAALLAGALAIGGLAVVDDILLCLLMPVVTTYLLADVGYLLLERLLLRLGMARLRAFLMPLVLAAALIGVFFAVNGQSEAVLFAAVDGSTVFAPQLIFADVATAHGPLAATLLWIASSAALVLAAVAASPRAFMPTRRFVRVPRVLGASEFAAHFDAHVRSIETITVYGLAIAGSLGLLLLHIALPPVLLIAVTVQAVYAAAAVSPLRTVGPRRHGPMTRYLLIIGPQFVGLALCAVPTGLLSALQGIPLDQVLAVIGFCLSNIVVLTLAGIVFPPEKGNPFSVIIGMATAALTTGTLLLGANILGLPEVAVTAALVATSLAAAALSIAGILRIERTERHEVGVQSTRKRRGRDRADRGGGGRDGDLVDVLRRRH